MATDMVLGIFIDRADAERAIADLEAHGYESKDISIVMRDAAQTHDIGTTTGANVAEGVVSGAATGAVVGALAGLLVGVGAIVLPGIGGVLIGGPIAVALGLTGAAATTAEGAMTGALAGGLIGALVGLGVPEEQARVYENRIKSGAILLAVPTVTRTGQPVEVRSILESDGAEQINEIISRAASVAA